MAKDKKKTKGGPQGTIFRPGRGSTIPHTFFKGRKNPFAKKLPRNLPNSLRRGKKATKAK